MNTAKIKTRKYKSLALAQIAARNQEYWVPVLMGDDGLFWVAYTNRDAGALMAAGYEAA